MMSATEKDEKLMEDMRKLVSLLLLLLLCIEDVTACTHLYVHVHVNMYVVRKFHKLKFLYTCICTLLRLILQCRG